MTNYIIVDDEPIAHRIVEGYCRNLPHLHLLKHCYDALQAIEFLNSNRVDLIFLDINMPKLKGFEFLRTLKHPPKIIVTTAYKEFALEGYELDVADYLLKPFSFERFLQAVNKATESEYPRQQGNESALNNRSDSIFLKGDKKHHQVLIDDILFVEAYGNYSKVHTSGQMIITHEKISTLEEQLRKFDFLRVHKSFLIATTKINEVESNLLHISSHKIPVGQTYRSVIRKILDN
ncbi:MAG: LytTR family DNA-binding domain-containing protein [Cyclobacteriaceae bacterium]